MSYTPTEWKNGDTITAEKLNHIEEGIENNNERIIELDSSGITNIESGLGVEDIFNARYILNGNHSALCKVMCAYQEEEEEDYIKFLIYEIDSPILCIYTISEGQILEND